ncbi:MAG: RibD family protein [Pseudomonadota bacterium]
MSVRVTLKLATSIDGRIALADGTSQWITSSEARAQTHEMRAQHDAVVVGVGTVLADDPMLTARTIPLPEKQPARLILDSTARTPLNGRLMSTLNVADLIIATNSAAAGSSHGKQGAKVWNCGDDGDGKTSLKGLIERCEVEGITRLFVEGGSSVAAAFVKNDLVDEIAWFRAPILLGGDGLSAIGALGLTKIDAAPKFRLFATEKVGPDCLDIYHRA